MLFFIRSGHIDNGFWQKKKFWFARECIYASNYYSFTGIANAIRKE